MKRVVSAVLSLLLIVSLSCPAQSVLWADRPPQNEMSAFLLERDFPEDYLEQLTPQQLEDLYYLVYKNNGYCLAAATPERSEIQPFGNIPPEQLSFSTGYIGRYVK